MPPRINPSQRSLSPPTSSVPNDVQDILVLQDMMDTLDQIPPELTRVHSDLNELGAVLYSTLVGLEKNLTKLIDWIQDPNITPDKRFELLQEIAEEAARYKLGGDDKIRVAGGACDGIMSHQRHVSNLLASSTLLQPTPLSPYSRSLTLSQLPSFSSTRRGQLSRAANSPFGIVARAGPSGTSNLPEGAVRDTPTKKKKSRMQAIMGDDEGSVVGEKKKAPAKKRRPRAVSPTDSLASNSGYTGKPMQPQTARQMAAAANKARAKADKPEESDDESGDEGDAREGALGLDVLDSLPPPGRSGNGTPVISGAVSLSTDKARPRNGRGKRSRDEEDEEEDEEEGEEEEIKPTKRSGLPGKNAGLLRPDGYDVDMADGDGIGLDGEVDSRIYCTCNQLGYGEMIACDDDDCAIEWYHKVCVGLDKTPEGIWICPQCTERRKKNPKQKRVGKAKARR